MTIELPETSKEIVSGVRTDIRNELPTADPYRKNSFLGAMSTAFGQRIFDFYLQIKELIRQLFWNTSTGTFLLAQASWFGISPLLATKAVGNTVASGTPGSPVAIGTTLTASGQQYQVTDPTFTIEAKTDFIQTISVSGGFANCVTTLPHNLATGIVVDIASTGAPYDGVHTITVTADNGLRFPVTSTGPPATAGTIDSTATQLALEAVEPGSAGNRDPGEPITFDSIVPGVVSDTFVPFEGLGTAIDIETEDALRDRFLSRVQNPVAHFNEGDVIAKCREFPGVGRVKVFRVTPERGQATIYFTMDKAIDIIPTGPAVGPYDGDIGQVFLKIQEIIPVNTNDVDFGTTQDIFVKAPLPTNTVFTFTVINMVNSAGLVVPADDEFIDAVKATLDTFFRTIPEINIDVDEKTYQAAIQNTIDRVTGNTMANYTLTAPTGDILVQHSEPFGIATLAAVNTP